MVPAGADEAAEATREIINKWQDAVITTNIVLEMYESERTVEALATIVDASGLAVLSLSNIDPARGMAISSSESKVKDIKMIMPDGNEIPAKIVLRDQDLDLAFICPTEKPIKTIPAIDLTNNAEPDIMDQIVILSRFGNVVGYASTASLGRIQAIVKKPRTLYVPDPLMGLVNGLGTPAFSLDGKVVGILLLRVKEAQGFGGNEMFRGIGGMNMLPVILPAEDILAVAKEAVEIMERE